ncbi:MAG: hypothetical protein ACETWQ_12975 [Phycisphaerae bacterium]
MVEIYFADEKVKKDFEKLRANEEFGDLYRFVCRAMGDIKNRPDCGTAMPKKLIPKKYVKRYGINNLYKYDLPNAWRLLYSLGREGIEIIAIILEWCSHKEYERIFKYRAR